ncbi:type IV pilus biogenesis protein PilM [Thermoactinomyces mirandus]|uniref:Pilus assembly protein PilM n=1 Tax=Thermoactinomyces mirandus TaxID=2756294 RepID=A0A7W1XTA6_9BACL|nr:pilus assembly protein PilM [Thermoactinomyces mirandus]MBA4602791.1 pilus assembly protein PilM [Thermoactinomyces mirandus]
MPYHIGIELSPSFFKLAEVKKRRNKMWLYQYVVHPLPSIWSWESSIWEREEFIQSVQEALLGRDLHTKRVHVAINSKYVIYKRVMVPEMRKRKYRSWLREYLLPVLDLPFSDPVFDYHLINHVWVDGDEQEVLLAITSSSYIDVLTKCLHYCGLDPVHIDLAPLGLYRWLNHIEDLSSSPFILLYLSKNEGEISYFIDGMFQGAHMIELPMTPCLVGKDRPYPDPLTPVLKTEEEVSCYGQALMEIVFEGIPDDLKKIFSCPNTRYILAGEGIDLSLLENWLIQNHSMKVKLAPPAEMVMTDNLRERASRWIGNSLSVPLGLMMD